MPENNQENPSNPQQQSLSHPSFELKQRIDQGTILQLVSESQLVLQNLLAHQDVFDNMATYYPKTFESIVQLVAAYEQLSVLLQEVGALQDIKQQEQEPESNEQKSQSKPKGPQSEEAHTKRKKANVGDEKAVTINNRIYKRRYGEDHQWHYVSGGQKAQNPNSTGG